MIDPETHEYDPVFVHSLREAKVILAVFAVFATYVLSTAFWLGLPRKAELDGEAIPTVMGVPSWVFWSIVVPWLAANVVTGWFCFGLLQKDPLEDKQLISGESTNEPSRQDADQSSMDMGADRLGGGGQIEHESR